ncbi:MAG: urate hydroxylase PuuD [Deltaproteobacteria bacterium]|nr:urate hydroxylase PuuD [Deltaproteobacteria bacterium]
MEHILFLFHWAHVLAGLIWIGTLYFFNFFLMPFLARTRPEVRTEVFHKLVSLTLGVFQWAPLVTVLSGGLIYLHRLTSIGSAAFFNLRYGLAISLGSVLGLVMFLNGWFVMHPKQKVVVASAGRVAQGGQPIPEAAVYSRRVVLTSRTNLLLSIPMLFFMVAATHYPSITAMPLMDSPAWFWLLVLVILAGIEMNALTGSQGATKKPLESLRATLGGAFILLAAFYVLFLMLI